MYPIVAKKCLNPTVTMMDIAAPLVARKAQAGQFIILRVDEDGERIPLTVAGYDRAAGTVRIIFQVVGATTEKLNHKQAGESIQDFVGPLGEPTHLAGLKKVCIVGGGVGCAIALPIAEALHAMGAEVHAIIGFRSRELLILEDEFRAVSDRLTVMTDDGSYGSRGTVTVPLQAALTAGAAVVNFKLPAAVQVQPVFPLKLRKRVFGTWDHIPCSFPTAASLRRGSLMRLL